MSQITICQAKKKDIMVIQKLMTELNNWQIKNFSEDNKPFHQRIKDYSKLEKNDIEKDIILVAEVDTKIIGYIWGSLHERKSHKLSKMGYIDEIYIENQFRQQGVGKKLLKNLEEEFIKLECDHLITHADWDNEVAKKSHVAWGMKPVTVEYWKKI